MSLTNDLSPNEKEATGAIRNLFNTNQFENLAGRSNGFCVSNYDEKSSELQCQICNPPLGLGKGKVKLCPGHTADGELLKNGLLENLVQHRTVRKIFPCIMCGECFALSKFSSHLSVCKKCFAQRHDPKAARKMAERARRNLNRMFGEVLV